MKIIELCYSLSSGGAEKFIVDLSNQLSKQGHDVTICMLRKENDATLIFNKKFIYPSVHFKCMNFDRGLTINKILKVTKYLKSEQPDIVHCHLNVIPYIFNLAITEKKIKFFHTLHNIAEATVSSKLQKFINHFFYKHSIIRPITISKLCQKSYEKFYQLDNAPYINNGRTPITASNCFEKTYKEVEEYKKTKDTLVFIHVARFNKQKNQELLIDSFNELNKRNIDFILLIIGNGFETPEAKRLIEKSCDKIYFLGVKDNIEDYLLCSNAFCLTSSYEGLPISLLEALSAGITPICTPVGGIPDVIIDNVYGYLSDDLSQDSYIKTIEKFINSPIPSQNLKNYFEQEFSMKKCSEAYLKEFQK